MYSENYTFEKYIKKAYTYLCCNISEEQRKKEYVICYDYTEKQIDDNLNYFKECYQKELSPYKALLFFYDYLIEQKYGK